MPSGENKRTAAVIEREEYIVELLKANHGETVSGKAFDRDLGIDKSVRYNTIHRLKQKYPQIKNLSNGGDAMYAWVEEGVKIEPQVTVKGNPVAAVAKNVRGIKPGEVWKAQESNGGTQMIYVLNTVNDKAQCIKLFRETDKKRGEIGKDYFQVYIGKVPFIGDPAMPTSKPLKYLACKEVDAVPTKLLEVRWMMGMTLGIAGTIDSLRDENEKLRAELEKAKKEDPWLKTENEDLKEVVARLKAKEEKYMTLKFEHKQLKGELAVTKEHCVKISNSLTEATEKLETLEHDLAEAKAKQEEKEVIREIVKEVPVEKVVYKDRPEVPEDYIHQSTARIAILTEERNVWKTVAMKLMEGKEKC